jgi:arylsulfatase
MEVFAGFLSHADDQIGRLLKFLTETGEFDNTLIMVVSDNGASAEGGATGTTNETQFFNNAPEPLEDSLAKLDELGGANTFNHYPWGWTWAGNTPFRRWKRETYRGGACDPFLVHWPAGIKARGETRTQYAHIIDMVPTVLDILGVEPTTTVRGVTQAPLRSQLRALVRRRERRHPAPHPVLRDVRPPCSRSRRLAGGVPVAGAVVRRGR